MATKKTTTKKTSSKKSASQKKTAAKGNGKLSGLNAAAQILRLGHRKRPEAPDVSTEPELAQSVSNQ